MNTKPLFYAPDGDTYRSGQAILNPQQDKQLTNDVTSNQGIYKTSGYDQRGILGDDDLTDDNLTEDKPDEEASVA